jgi:DNA-directed RNA polymerase subunit omega
MRDDYIKEALRTVPDPNILINVVSRRVKQLKRGSRPLVESLEKLAPEDVALREIIEDRITWEFAPEEPTSQA